MATVLESNELSMDSFVELCNKTQKTELEQTLIQCIATISTHPAYSRLDPQRIYEMMRDLAYRIDW